MIAATAAVVFFEGANETTRPLRAERTSDTELSGDIGITDNSSDNSKVVAARRVQLSDDPSLPSKQSLCPEYEGLRII